jgi:hypothetical protein
MVVKVCPSVWFVVWKLPVPRTMKLSHLLLAGLAVFSALPVLRSTEVKKGLVDYYRFHGNLNDSSGNGFNLTGVGVFSYVSNQNGRPNSAIQMGASSQLNGIGPELAYHSSSISFWVMKNYIGDGTNGSWVFGLGNPGAGSAGTEMHVALDRSITTRGTI